MILKWAMFRRMMATPKQKLKNYKFPEVRKEDCEQKYISGWGPGGQKVNTAQNAVQLTHIPTGTVVKVHESRLLPKNIDIAFERMKFVLDRQINGENCYEEQLKMKTQLPVSSDIPLIAFSSQSLTQSLYQPVKSPISILSKFFGSPQIQDTKTRTRTELSLCDKAQYEALIEQLNLKLKAQSVEIESLKKALVSETKKSRDLLRKEKESQKALESQIEKLNVKLKIKEKELQNAKSESELSLKVESLKREVKNLSSTVKEDKNRNQKLKAINRELQENHEEVLMRSEQLEEEIKEIRASAEVEKETNKKLKALNRELSNWNQKYLYEAEELRRKILQDSGFLEESHQFQKKIATILMNLESENMELRQQLKRIEKKVEVGQRKLESAEIESSKNESSDGVIKFKKVKWAEPRGTCFKGSKV
ncbi:hypothetical protein CAEBREN_16253 [Caenorhabditis brenneri]|uniref:Prokaryotic-type class I peptide chain release factors domain-containing protein n=1 Tax=Caenorhabditis brenneri TaxID=135651 RepID=G0NUI3_CAEBE|nr:hypothetical protein CAEBREN_16253 [Caenorhabditis brenneri]